VVIKNEVGGHSVDYFSKWFEIFVGFIHQYLVGRMESFFNERLKTFFVTLMNKLNSINGLTALIQNELRSGNEKFFQSEIERTFLVYKINFMSKLNINFVY